MPASAEYERIASLFFPDHLKARRRVEQENLRFAHYTSAAVAANIIRNPFVWMRNALTMNDFMEIQHGKNCFISAYKNDTSGKQLKTFLESIYPGIISELEIYLEGWIPHLENDTYLTSISEHLSHEDAYGRLSMWRAYGQKSGVALILNNAPFLAETDELKAFSSPVAYLTINQYNLKIKTFTEHLISKEYEVRQFGRERTLSVLFTLFKNDILCTKHPGFAEEREWRIYYSPTVAQSPAIEMGIEIIEGIPQIIYKIPLKNAPQFGLHGADIDSILYKLIIGPCEYPLTLYQAFLKLMRDAGISNPEGRIVVSDIPLRT